ncbi:MAG: ATP-dependent 6-phosphofructokinase [Bacilli bacterium]
MIKKIGILASGGDAPGMNCAMIGAIRAGYKLGKEMYVIKHGYKGLVEGEIEKVSIDYAKWSASMGGTVIKTARLPEFKEPEVQKKAIANLKGYGIDALIVIGGDGSYMGAKKLTEQGINCIGLPGTIDNDISSTDYTIGFDTALNTIVRVIDDITDTMSSHNRCGVIEIMGNKCGDLTLFAGIATHADYIITADHPVNIDDFIKELKEFKKTNPDHVTILVSEKTLDTAALVDRITEETGFDTRLDVLGYVQRGGRPSAMERFNSTRMGAYAVKLLDKGIGGVCVGIVNNELHYQDIYEALKTPRDKHEELYKDFDLIN